jgi:hypothetical protein
MWPSLVSQRPSDLDSPVAWMPPKSGSASGTRRPSRLHRSIGAVRDCTCGPLMRCRFLAGNSGFPFIRGCSDVQAIVASDHQEHIGSVSFVVSFSYVRPGSPGHSRPCQRRSQTATTDGEHGSTDLESVLGATPQEFESLILRQLSPAEPQNQPIARAGPVPGRVLTISVRVV